ncbi:MAG: sulfurtransferase-like selenium metabolism protein YedF [Bacillota bacterium]
MRELDGRGKPCPQPVLLVKQAVDAGHAAFSILVDNRAAVENVTRFGQKSGYRIQVEELQGCWRVTGTRSEKASGEKAAETGLPVRRTQTGQAPGAATLVEAVCGTPVQTLVIQSPALGRDDEELGRRLIKILLDTLAANETRPRTIILLNAGVKLACEGSEVLEALRDLEEKGVRILACGTCLNHFNLNQALKVGKPTNAYEVVNTLLLGGVLVWG